MIADYHEVSDLKIRMFLAFLTILGMIVLAGTYPGDPARGAAPTTPRITSITQVTHDGYPKINLLADDSQLYVTELPALNRVIAKVTLPNSDRSLVQSPFSSLQALDLSADRTKLLISTQGKSRDSEFWTLPIAAGKPQRVGDLSGRDASWSADSNELVFAKGSSLHLAGSTGAQTRQLYSAGGSVFAPRLSPDGQRIRFTVSDTENSTTSLWEIRRDGSNPHALLGNWQYKSAACCGSWTSDGRYYIFQATQTLPNTTVVVTTLWALADSKANSDSAAEPVPLTGAPMSFGNVSAARDNKKIWAIGVEPKVEVVKYDPGKQHFQPVIPGLSATDLDFSADGKWVAYVAIPEGTLWRSRADGSDRLQLTLAPDRAALPRWSPDGKQIAFASMKPGESWKLSLVPAAGGESRYLLSENGSQIDANWSSDGSQLMFGDFNHDTSGINIRIIDFKTRKLDTIPGSEGLFSPRWSPNGKHIVALSPDSTALMLFDYDTQKWSKWLTETAGSVSYPAWSKDSQSLYFDDLVNGAETIRRLKIGERQPESVFVLPGIDRYMGALGPWSGRAPDGSWMFVRDRSTQEVYQLAIELP